MVIEPSAAHHFIAGYQCLLALVDAQSTQPSGLTGMNLLVHSRRIIADDPARLDAALNALAEKGEALADDVRAAVQSLQLKQWVYLRDTTQYSVFIDPALEKAYAVLGLTQPLKQVIGGSGASIHTGVMAYRGQYVCDGLFSGQLVWLGAGYKTSFSENLADIKKRQNFYKTPTALSSPSRQT